VLEILCFCWDYDPDLKNEELFLNPNQASRKVSHMDLSMSQIMAELFPTNVGSIFGFGSAYDLTCGARRLVLVSREMKILSGRGGRGVG
jgi:hypothetical protein